MKHWLPMGLLPLVLCAIVQAQTDFSAAQGSRHIPASDFFPEKMMVLTGKVVSEEGFALPGNVTVVFECGSDARARGHSDAQGNFSLTLEAGNHSSSPSFSRSAAGMPSAFSLTDCELYGELTGYRSERVRISARSDSGIMQVGVITLHPISPEDSLSVSATSMAAPGKAKQALEKGRQQAKKKKWAAAASSFKRAIEVYPRYALAWVELGRTQIQQNSFSEAQQSFQQSVEQDSRFIDGYVGLAYVALMQDQWKELADTTARVVEFAPTSPQFWFLNALASYNLGNTKQAEVSIARGFRLDPQHQIPDMEYLYGLILARRHNYDAAAEHINTYLALAPGASNAGAAREALAQLQRQAQNSTTASP